MDEARPFPRDDLRHSAINTSPDPRVSSSRLSREQRCETFSETAASPPLSLLHRASIKDAIFAFHEANRSLNDYRGSLCHFFNVSVRLSLCWHVLYWQCQIELFQDSDRITSCLYIYVCDINV